MSKQIASTEKLNKLQMLEFLWLSVYNNRHDFSEKQWQEYHQFVREYLQHELELMWLEFYKNKDNLNKKQWENYDKLIHQYLRLAT